MRNDPYTVPVDGTLPPWLRIVVAYDNLNACCRLQGVLQAQDADAALFDLAPINQLFAPGRSPRVTLTKRQILESVLETVSKQLAELALEDK